MVASTAALAESWKFPVELIDAIANVNHPGRAVESKRLACLVFLARDIHHRWDSMDTKEKLGYLKKHKAAIALNLNSDLTEKIDTIRGQGSEMAYQLL